MAAAGEFTAYTSFIDELLDGTQDWVTDDHCLVRLTSSYTPDVAHSTYADISTYETGTNIDLTGEAVSTASSVTKLDADDATFSGAATCRYAAIVQSTVAGIAAGSKLCGYVLLDSTPADVSLTTLAFGSGGIFRFGAGTSVAGPSVGGVDGSDVPSFVEQAWEVEDVTIGPHITDGATVNDWAPCLGSIGLRGNDDDSTNRWPTYRATAATDGNPSVEFDGTNDRLWVTFASAIAQPLSYALVVETLDAAADLIAYIDGNSNRCHIYQQSSNLHLFAGGTVGTITPPGADGNVHFIAGVFNGSSSILQLDGTRQTGLNPGTSSLDELILGGAGNNFNGYVYALYFAEVAWSTTNLDDLYSHVQTKYGVA